MTASAAPARRLVLVPSTSYRDQRSDARLRRYRLARIRLEGKAPAERFAHLKRSHD